MNTTQPNEHLLTLRQVMWRLKCSRTTIYRLLNDPASGFPRPFALVERGKLLFLCAEIEDWLYLRRQRNLGNRNV